MHWRDGLAITAAAFALTACSDGPQLARTFDESPDVAAAQEPVQLASGTAVDADDPDSTIEWNLEEIVGFSHAVSFRAETPTATTVRSASRQGIDDQLWIVGASLAQEGPKMVFGGAADSVESLVLVNDDGDEFSVDLIEVPGMDWHVAVEQLPEDWIDEGTSSRVEVVAIQDGAEIVREELLGFSR